MARPFGKIRRFIQLSPAQAVLLLRAFVLLQLSWLGIRLLGCRRWCLLLARMNGRTKPPHRQRVGLAAVGAPSTSRLVGVAARHSLAPVQCLERSVVLWSLLRRQGIDAQVRFGMRKVGTRLQGHAWVEAGGQPLGEASDVAREFTGFAVPLGRS